MEKLMFHEIVNGDYIGIITILDYEIRLSKCLTELSFPSQEKESSRKVIVDMSLKSGLNEYRFAEFTLDNNGKIMMSTHKYMKTNDIIEQLANRLLQEKEEIVLNSVLPRSKKQEILNAHK